MKKIKVIILCLLGACLIGTLSGCGKDENLIKAEEAIEEREFDKAKQFTDGGKGKTEELHQALRMYLQLANDIRMGYIHVQLDKNVDSEFEEKYQEAKEIPKIYKDYPELELAVDNCKDGLKKAIELEKDLRKEYPDMDEAYQNSQSSVYNAIAQEWRDKINEKFPVSAEESSVTLSFNNIFMTAIMPYLSAGFDPSAFEGIDEFWEQMEEFEDSYDYVPEGPVEIEMN